LLEKCATAFFVKLTQHGLRFFIDQSFNALGNRASKVCGEPFHIPFSRNQNQTLQSLAAATNAEVARPISTLPFFV